MNTRFERLFRIRDPQSEVLQSILAKSIGHERGVNHTIDRYHSDRVSTTYIESVQAFHRKEFYLHCVPKTARLYNGRKCKVELMGVENPLPELLRLGFRGMTLRKTVHQVTNPRSKKEDVFRYTITVYGSPFSMATLHVTYGGYQYRGLVKTFKLPKWLPECIEVTDQADAYNDFELIKRLTPPPLTETPSL